LARHGVQEYLYDMGAFCWPPRKLRLVSAERLLFFPLSPALVRGRTSEGRLSYLSLQTAGSPISGTRAFLLFFSPSFDVVFVGGCSVRTSKGACSWFWLPAPLSPRPSWSNCYRWVFPAAGPLAFVGSGFWSKVSFSPGPRASPRGSEDQNWFLFSFTQPLWSPKLEPFSLFFSRSCVHQRGGARFLLRRKPVGGLDFCCPLARGGRGATHASPNRPAP